MKYVKNAWYVAAWSPDLELDKLSAVRILNEPIVLWRTEKMIIALADRCVHRLAPLSLGRCENGKLRCMYHGLLYDNQGKCVQIPGQDIIPPGARVRSFPVIERHSWIWVWMGDPARADETLIPPAVGLEDPPGFLDTDNWTTMPRPAISTTTSSTSVISRLFMPTVSARGQPFLRSGPSC
jgi:vanillate O-demethylase monooxygenase subunit